MDDVWPKTVEFIAKRNYRIDTIERDSGVISSTDVKNSKGDFLKYADCGHQPCCFPIRNKFDYTVFVKENSTEGTDVTVNIDYSVYWAAANPQFDRGWGECTSRGILKGELLDWIGTRVGIPTADH